MNTPNNVDITNIEEIENKFKVVRNIKIAYKDEGSGHTIFCIPPWPSGSTAFNAFIVAFKDKFRIITLDLPGWAGYSDQMIEKPTIDNYTDIIEEFILSFDIDDYSLLGYSFGGVFVQATIEREKVKPKKLIFVSTLHSGNEINNEFHSYLKLYRQLSSFKFIYHIRKQLFGLFFLGKRVVGSSYYKKYLKTPYYKQLIKEGFRANIDTVFDAMYSLFHAEYMDPLERKFDCLVIYAEFDPSFIKSETEEMAKFFGCEPTIIKGADHDHFTFDINKSSQVIMDFLEKKPSFTENMKSFFTF